MIVDDPRIPRLPPVALVREASGPDEEANASESEMPLPSPQTFFLGGLFVLSVFAALYVASSIILPIVLAFVLKLLLQPAVRLLERMHLPSVVGRALGNPASYWIACGSYSGPISTCRDVGGEVAGGHTAP